MRNSPMVYLTGWGAPPGCAYESQPSPKPSHRHGVSCPVTREAARVYRQGPVIRPRQGNEIIEPIGVLEPADNTDVPVLKFERQLRPIR